VATSFVLLMVAGRPNLCISAPCIHNLVPSSSDTHTHYLHKCLCGYSVNLTKELIQLKKNTGKKKSQFIFSVGAVPCFG